VDKALNNNKWIEHLVLINDADELKEYAELWEVIQQIQEIVRLKMIFGGGGQQVNKWRVHD